MYKMNYLHVFFQIERDYKTSSYSWIFQFSWANLAHPKTFVSQFWLLYYSIGRAKGLQHYMKNFQVYHGLWSKFKQNKLILHQATQFSLLHLKNIERWLQ